MTFKKAALAMVAATSLVAMPTVAMAQTSASKLSLANAPGAERAAPDAEGSNLGGGSIIVAILAAAAVIAAIVIAVDGGDNAISA